MNTDFIAEELRARGTSAESFGTHSFRKGASTFCSSGSTACPSGTSVHLRAGWALGGVQDTYLRYDAAGDQYVGRTVAGLPLDASEFAILPPFFPDRNESVKQTIRECFPKRPAGMDNVLEYVLASVVYHSRFLREHLPTSHLLFSSTLFRSSTALSSLSNIVQCRLARADDSIRPTGIPPHVTALNRLQVMTEKIAEIVPELNNIPSTVVEGVMAELESRAIGAGTVTRSGLKDLLNDCLSEAGVFDLVNKLSTGIQLQSAVAENELITASADNARVHFWGGKLHILPEDFTFPNCGVLVAWQIWCCGDASKQIPALIRVSPIDLSTKDLRKRLSDFRFLMHRIQSKVTGEISLERITISQCNDLFLVVENELESELATSLNNTKKRRVSQMKWSTAVNLIRKHLRSHDV
jgi:hypothetical protein